MAKGNKAESYRKGGAQNDRCAEQERSREKHEKVIHSARRGTKGAEEYSPVGAAPWGLLTAPV